MKNHHGEFTQQNEWDTIKAGCSKHTLRIMEGAFDLTRFNSRGQWSFSNTIYPTEDNFKGIISRLVRHHGRNLTLEELNEINFLHYSESGNSKSYDVFLSQFSTVFHMWGLYYIDSNGIFLLTPLALQYYRGEIDYETMNLVFCSRTQFPKPQVLRQPNGPLRPVISLIRVFKSLTNLGEDSRLSIFEMNFFSCYITADNEVEDFVRDLLSYRKNNSLIPSSAVSNTFGSQPSNGVSGILRMARVANIIEKENGSYQLVKT